MRMRPMFTLAAGGWLLAAGPALAVRSYAPEDGMWTLGLVVGAMAVAFGFAVYLYMQGTQRAAQASELMGKLKDKDAVWDEAAFLRRARDTFHAVYPLATPLDVERVESYLTPAYKQKLTEALVRLQKQRRQRKPGRGDIGDIQVIHVDDRLDDAQDRVWVLLQYFGDFEFKELAAPVSWLARHDDNRTFDGSSGIRQVWKYVRVGDTWLLEDIVADSDIGAYQGTKIQSEEPPAP